MVSKEIWVECFEKLEAELGREPTPEEVDEAVIDYYAGLADRAKDIRKYGE